MPLLLAVEAVVSGMAAQAVLQHQGLRRCQCGAAAARLLLQHPGLPKRRCTGGADSAARYTPEKAAVVLWAATMLGVQARHTSGAQVRTLSRVAQLCRCCTVTAVQHLRLHWCVACGAVPSASVGEGLSPRCLPTRSVAAPALSGCGTGEPS